MANYIIMNERNVLAGTTVKKVSGFGDLSKWEEVTEELKTQWEVEHPAEIPEGMVENN